MNLIRCKKDIDIVFFVLVGETMKRGQIVTAHHMTKSSTYFSPQSTPLLLTMRRVMHSVTARRTSHVPPRIHTADSSAYVWFNDNVQLSKVSPTACADCPITDIIETKPCRHEVATLRRHR